MKYEDIGKVDTFNTNLLDEMKPNGVDLLLPYEDFNSGWILLSKGSSVTVTHNFGKVPRLASAFVNNSAVDNGCDYCMTYDVNATVIINNFTVNTVTITNKSGVTSNKYIKILLWR